MSINLLLENDTDPVIWRGPILGGTVKQFWTDVVWGDIDYMFIDMPPGTGDVPLTVFQSLSVDGIVIVTSPQELVSMIVSKAVKMAEMMHIPIMGVVENMAYASCPTCGKKIDLFGNGENSKMGLPEIGSIPVDPEISRLCDDGKIENYQIDLDKIYQIIENI